MNFAGRDIYYIIGYYAFVYIVEIYPVTTAFFESIAGNSYIIAWAAGTVENYPALTSRVVGVNDSIIDKMGLLMNHLYQKSSYGKKECNFEIRMIGLLVLHSLVVDIRLSDKRKTKDVIFDFGISIQIGSSNHTETECEE